MILQISDRAKIAIEVFGTYHLRLLSDFKLDIKDYYFIPIASQNLIFISVLGQDGFDFCFNKDFYSIYL